MATDYDVLIVGAGFAGSTAARILAEQGNKILLIEKRPHIGGNMYDFTSKTGVTVHKYGPHIYHTNSDAVHRFLSRFTEWWNYSHEVVGWVDEKFVVIPFNLNSLEITFPNYSELRELLIGDFGMEQKVPILEMMNHSKQSIREIADYIYRKIFLYYTLKQWGISPEEIDPSVTGRVPVYISYDNRYFRDKYQGLPKDGFINLFTKMLDHENIVIKTGVDAKNIIAIDPLENRVEFRGEIQAKQVIYTGAIDELFNYRYGTLPYRSLHFQFEDLEKSEGPELPKGTVNFPGPPEIYPYTRVTDFWHFSTNKPKYGTTIVKEFPGAYNIHSQQFNSPYYPVINEHCIKIYNQYQQEAQSVKNLHLLGRLAEYKYYNMDSVIERTITYIKENIN